VRPGWPTVAALLVATFLQASIAPHLAVFGVVPNVLLLVVVTLALVEGPVPGAFAGFTAGVLLDMLGTSVIGPWALVLCVVGYVAGTLNANMFAEGWLLPITVAFMASLLAELSYGLLLAVLGVGGPFVVTLTHIVIPAAVYNTALAVLVYPWLARLLRQDPGMTEFRRMA
jgi:rod shape-determining protein MreD